MLRSKLEEMKVVELKEMCKNAGLRGYSKMRKAQLIDMLVEALEVAQAEETKEVSQVVEVPNVLDVVTNEVVEGKEVVGSKPVTTIKNKIDAFVLTLVLLIALVQVLKVKATKIKKGIKMVKIDGLVSFVDIEKAAKNGYTNVNFVDTEKTVNVKISKSGNGYFLIMTYNNISYISSIDNYIDYDYNIPIEFLNNVAA